jgi:poly(A) polymerase Pap1
MPIITPAYPSICATHSVSASIQAILKEEFQRGNVPLLMFFDFTKEGATIPKDEYIYRIAKV